MTVISPQSRECSVLDIFSANRDESVFTNPHEFDLSRSPNLHMGFGGGGPHL